METHVIKEHLMTWKNIQDILVEGKSRFLKGKRNMNPYLKNIIYSMCAFAHVCWHRKILEGYSPKYEQVLSLSGEFSGDNFFSFFSLATFSKFSIMNIRNLIKAKLNVI